MKRVITVQVRMQMRRTATQQEVRQFIQQALRTEMELRDGSGQGPNAPVEPEPLPVIRIVQLDTTYTKE